MKYTLLITAIGVILLVASCKKDPDKATQFVVTPTYPTITFTAPQYFSIKTGGTIPSVSATSYDSVLGESYPVSLVGTEAVDASKPGLYIVSAKATNRYGYFTKVPVLIAVTNVPANVNLSGNYKRLGTSAIAHVMKLATGLYSSDNLFGSTTTFATLYFAQTSDSTIDIPDQDTEVGRLTTAVDSLHLSPTDTSFSYKIVGGTLTLNDALRTFKKQ